MADSSVWFSITSVPGLQMAMVSTVVSPVLSRQLMLL